MFALLARKHHSPARSHVIRDDDIVRADRTLEISPTMRENIRHHMKTYLRQRRLKTRV
jgi:hypothetical protein